MATYPVLNKETETKDVVMSIHDWDQWKKDNPEWERYFTLKIHQVLELRLVNGEINLSTRILDGVKFSRKLEKSGGISGLSKKRFL